ncbi:MAG TPA: AbrB/MazE/SpoVT family DNA-binding domain-containing protein [Candidatus Saccharimonadales bacterium]|nr:AbrB/MazE/SpoVT family DNA-binding domain-containing protein [Candidatus Saccharimonadales bacterium]
MNGISTLTQKGQIAIPKEIRDHFKLKPSDKIRFFIKDAQIIAEPISSIEKMFGSIKSEKVLTKQEIKKTVKRAVIEKYDHRP